MAAGLTAVTIMDDTNTATATWLTFTLAHPKSTKLCKILRESIPTPRLVRSIIEQHLAGQSNDLSLALQEYVSDSELQALHSIATRESVRQALEWEAFAPSNHIIGLDHPAYPAQLRDTDFAPPVLYAQGSISALDRPLIAVVGSRKASHGALTHTRHLCRELASMDIGIVSGLALGIDAAAHEGALEVDGVTIAVAATEPNRVYPKRHAALAARIIASGGLILTEYPLGSVTRPWFFPQRNRIISGLSLGVLVAEASLPSGTLTTATHAMNQGREVMAVPGSIHNLQARGCHALIKQGAALVESTPDILDTLAQPLQRSLDASKSHPKQAKHGVSHPPKTVQTKANPFAKSLSDTDKWLLNCLDSQSASIDDLMTLAQKDSQAITISALNTALGWLEIKGLITAETGGRYARC